MQLHAYFSNLKRLLTALQRAIVFAAKQENTSQVIECIGNCQRLALRLLSVFEHSLSTSAVASREELLCHRTCRKIHARKHTFLPLSPVLFSLPLSHPLHTRKHRIAKAPW